MRSPAHAFTWQLWHRGRWMVAALLAYAGALAVAAHLPGALAWRQTLFMSALPLGFGAVFLLALFTYPEADVLGCDSGFPPYALTLPVRTRQLVFWPMLHGAITAALCWIVPARLILIPLGVTVPLAWPAALLAALLVWLQALLWSPFALPYLRVMLALIALPSLVALGVNAALQGVSPVVLLGVFALLGGLAYGTALGGVARARRGDSPEWYWLPAVFQAFRRSGVRGRKDRVGVGVGVGVGVRSIALTLTPTPTPTPTRSSPERLNASVWSPGRAQLWFEWRSTGLRLPLVLAAVCFLLSLPLLWVRDMAPLGAGLGEIEVNLWLKLLQPCLFAPPLFAAILGCGRRLDGTRGRELSLPPFLGTRPLRAGEFVMAKLQAAALSTLAGWGIMLLFVTAWLLLPAREGATTAPLLVLLVRQCPPRTALTLLLLLGFLMVWTWKNQVQGLFADLSGRAWLAYGAPIIAHGLAFVAFVQYLQWSAVRVGTDLVSSGVPAVVPWGIGVALVLKLLAAGWGLHAVRQQRLLGISDFGFRISDLGTDRTGEAAVACSRPSEIRNPKSEITRSLATLAALWGIGALCLFGALSWIATQGALSSPLARSATDTYLPICGAGVPAALRSPATLASLAALFLPFTRLLMAPLTFEWNRHR